MNIGAKVAQELGVGDTLGFLREEATSQPLVKGIFAAVALFVSTKWVDYGPFILIAHITWASWMLLGWARAMDRKEEFCIDKIFSGVWKLVAVWAVTGLSGGLEWMVSLNGKDWALMNAAFTWMSVGMAAKALVCADHFFPGIGTVFQRLGTMLPNREMPPTEATPTKAEGE